MKNTEILKERATDKKYRNIILAFIVIVVAVLISFFVDTGGNNNKKDKKPKDIVSTDMLIGSTDDELVLEKLSKRINTTENSIKGLESTISDNDKNINSQLTEIVSKMTQIQQEITTVKRDRHRLFKDLADHAKQIKVLRELKPGAYPVDEDNVEIVDATHTFPFSDLPDKGPAIPLQTSSDTLSQAVLRKAGEEETMVLTQTVIGQTDRSQKAKEAMLDYLAIGIIKGVLVSGVDAPVGNQSRQDPMPVLIRVTDLARLPNLQRLDVKECFILASGYGVLSTERVNLRTEVFSCLFPSKTDPNRNDVIELELKGYVAGEDGKAGLRGRVVSRDGAILAKMLLAGALSGFSDAARPQAINTLATRPVGSNTAFQQPALSDLAQSAAYGGASEATQSLADYYEDLADEIFPVIEVSAGRPVEVIVTKGLSLETKLQTERNR